MSLLIRPVIILTSYFYAHFCTFSQFQYPTTGTRLLMRFYLLKQPQSNKQTVDNHQ